MSKCDFCGKEIPKGTGKLYIKKDGKSYRLCTSKCEKNLLHLGRKARNLSWTEEGRKAKQEAMK